MKERYISLTAVLTTLSIGVALGSLLMSAHRHPANISWIAAPAQPCPSAITSPDPRNGNQEAVDDDFPVDNDFRDILNGTRLDLRHKLLSGSDFADAKVAPLPDGRTLAAVGDTLYMLDANKRVAWKHQQSQMVVEYALVEATNLVYGTAGDNTLFILDASSGREMFRDSRSGGAAYSQVKAFGRNQCLVLDDFSHYRRDWDGLSRDALEVETWSDGITAWQGTQILWRRRFPPDAGLHVNDDKIFAVTKTRNNIYVQEIEVPR